VAGFEAVVEFLSQPGCHLRQDLARIHRIVEAGMEREDDLQLREVGLDRRLHIRILELGGKRPAIERDRAMHLPERGGGRRLILERGKALAPLRPQLRLHAPAHEAGTHRRRLRLELGELARVLRRKRFGNGGQELRHLHERTLEPAQRRGELRGLRAVIALDAEEPLARDLRRHRADVGADPDVARRARREAIVFVMHDGPC